MINNDIDGKRRKMVWNSPEAEIIGILREIKGKCDKIIVWNLG